MNIFASNDDVHRLVNIGCCYHLLDEMFKTDELYGSKKFSTVDSVEFGFPLSEFLRKQEFSLGRNARMLASQSIERTIANRSMEPLSKKSLFYRAVLEIILQKYRTDDKSVQCGKIKKFQTFSDYVRQCLQRTNLTLNMNDAQLEEFLINHDHHEQYLNLFYLIRMTFAPVLESIILLDRLLFLHEKRIRNVFLVKMFESIVSPRCYGIVALK